MLKLSLHFRSRKTDENVAPNYSQLRDLINEDQNG